MSESIVMGFIKKNKRLATVAAALTVGASALTVGALISPTLAAFTSESTATATAATGQWIVPAASLTATNGDFMNITVSWDAVPGYPDYTLQSISTKAGNGQWDSSNATLTEYAIINRTTYTLSNLNPGTGLAFRVRPSPARSPVAGGWGAGQAAGTVAQEWTPVRVGGLGWNNYNVSGYGDANNDKISDLAAVDRRNNVLYFYPNSGDALGTPGARSVASNNWDTSHTKMTSGEPLPLAEGTGSLIYVDTSTASDKLTRVYGPDNGGFISASILGLNGWKNFSFILAVGDPSGVKNSGILAINGTAEYRFYPWDKAEGTLSRTGTQVKTNWSKYSSLIRIGDLNGDGMEDVLGVDSTRPDQSNVWFIPGVNDAAKGYFNSAGATLIPRMTVDAKDTFIGNGDVTKDGIFDFYEFDTSGTGTRIPGAVGYQALWSGADMKRALSTVIGISGYQNGQKV